MPEKGIRWSALSPPYIDRFPLPVRFRPKRFTAEEQARFAAEDYAHAEEISFHRVGDAVVDVSLIGTSTTDLFAFDAETGEYPRMLPTMDFYELEIVTVGADGQRLPAERLREAANYLAKAQFYREIGAPAATDALAETFLSRLSAADHLPIQVFFNDEARGLLESPFRRDGLGGIGNGRNCASASQTLTNPILARYPGSLAASLSLPCALGPNPALDCASIFAADLGLSRWFLPVVYDETHPPELGDIVATTAHQYAYLLAGFVFQKRTQGSYAHYHLARMSDPSSLEWREDLMTSPERRAGPPPTGFRRKDPHLDPSAAIPATLLATNTLTRLDATAVFSQRPEALRASMLADVNRIFGTALADVELLRMPEHRCALVYTDGSEGRFRVDSNADVRLVMGSYPLEDCTCTDFPNSFGGPTPARVELYDRAGHIERTLTCKP